MALSDESIHISSIRRPSNAGSPDAVTGLGHIYHGNAIMIAVLAVELFVLLVHVVGGLGQIVTVTLSWK